MFILFSCSKLVLQPITNGFVYATLSLNRVARRVLTICKKSWQRTSNSDTRQGKMYQRTSSFRSTLCHLLSSPILFFRWEISYEVLSFSYKTISVGCMQNTESIRNLTGTTRNLAGTTRTPRSLPVTPRNLDRKPK